MSDCTEVTITILDVYPGEKSSDTCVDYVSPDFEYEETQSPQPEARPPADAQDGPPSEGPPAEGPPIEGPPAKVNDDPFGDLDLPDAEDLELEPR